MSKIEEFADDIPNILKGLDEDFGDLGERARALKERGKDVAHAWRMHFDGKAAELARAEEAIKRVSNIPLPASSTAPKVNGVDAKPGETAHLPEAKAGG